MPIEKEDGYRLIQAGISYTTLTNDAINSIKNPVAVAIWVHLCSKPKDWIVRRSEIMERFDIGRDKYQDAMRELRVLGLVWDYQVRDPDGNYKDRGVVCANALGQMDSLKNRSTNGQPDLPKDGKTEIRQIRPLSNKRSSTNEIPITNQIVIPAGINLEAWAEWVKFRKDRKKPISPQAANKQFKTLLKHNEITQAQIIDKSISNDYQGLFEPKQLPSAPPQSRRLKPL